MKLFSSKKRVAAIGAITAATLVTGGVAVAYWTNGGAGTGSATAGTTTDNLTITATGATGLVPGGPAQALDLHVVNPNSYSVQLENLTVSIDSGTVACDGNPVADTWFTLDASTITDASVIPAAVGAVNGEGDLAPSGVTLQMNNTTDNQNICKSADVTFDLTVS